MTGNDSFEQHSGADPTSNEDKKPPRNMEETTSNYNGSADKNQHLGDTSNDANEAYKYSAGDSRDDNNHTPNTDNNSKKRGKVICYDFQKGLCRRRNCRVSSKFVLASVRQSVGDEFSMTL